MVIERERERMVMGGRGGERVEKKGERERMVIGRER